MFVYRAFGLTLASELRCPELLPAHGNADVVVRIRANADGLGGAPQPLAGFDAGPGRFELGIPRVGRFVVQRGERIDITPEPAADEESLRLFLLGTAMGALLHQRATLPLHGSAIEKNGRSVLIVGVSGAGKSTLAAALAQRGWSVQSDDISVVTVRDGRAECEPGFPTQKMWPDVLQMLGEDATRFAAVRIGLEKRSVPLDRSTFRDSPSVIAAVVAVTPHRGTAPVLTEILGPRRMALLKRLTFREHLRTPLQMNLAQFEIIARLAGQARVWRLHRPRSGASPGELAEFVERELGEAVALPFDAGEMIDVE